MRWPHTSKYVFSFFIIYIYKGSVPRVADAARHARARRGRMQPKICKGSRKKRPMIWCEHRFDNAKSCLCRANCPVVVSCAVCFCYRCYVLIGSTGVFCVGEKTGGRERSIHVEKKRRKVAHNNTYYTRYCFMFERKHTAQHDTAPQRRARHRTARLRTALRCAAGLYIAGPI